MMAPSGIFKHGPPMSRKRAAPSFEEKGLNHCVLCGIVSILSGCHAHENILMKFLGTTKLSLMLEYRGLQS